MWSGKAGEEEKVGEVKGVVGMVVVVKRRAKMSLFIWAGGWCPLETKAARWKLFDMGI